MMDGELREEMVRFLSGEGIESLDDDGFDERYEQLVDGLSGDERFMVFLNMEDKIPAFHDLYSSYNSLYDWRIIILNNMIDFIDKDLRHGEGKLICDGGMGTGLDISFLAKHYSGDDMKFFGYDNNESMVKYAEKKKKRLGLKNSEFYVSEHSSPGDFEMSKYDFMFINHIEVRDEDDPEEISGLLLGGCERVRPGGVFMLTYDLEDHEEKVSEYLKSDGIFPLRKDYLFSSFSEEVNKKIDFSSYFYKVN